MKKGSYILDVYRLFFNLVFFLRVHCIIMVVCLLNRMREKKRNNMESGMRE